MSDSEDDFMSDKFLVEAPAPIKSYTEKRNAQKLKSLRAGQAKNLPTLAVLEKERRHAGLNTSLLDPEPPSAGPSSSTTVTVNSSTSMNTGRDKALEMMKKMGWKAGEGLGKRRSPSPPSSSKRARLDDDDESEEGTRGGLGSSKRAATSSASGTGGVDTARGDTGGGIGGGRGRVEPIRISMWAGRKGLSAREESPPPLPNTSGRNVDWIDPKQMKRLEGQTEDYREFQKKSFTEKETERKEAKARELLMDFDREKGIKFHPLHVLPGDPLATLPRPLLKRIYPSQYLSPVLSPTSPPRSRSPSPPLAPKREVYVSNAEKLRDQMRKDMLSELGKEEEDDEPLALGKAPPAAKRPNGGGPENGVLDPLELEEGDMDWDELVSGTKRVLSMDFLLDQLRHEHMFCFWCSFKYKSFEEMDGPGGCPGEDEDDH